MRNELEKFHHTVGILVSAYMNDTLQHGSCYACAVGNLIAHNRGFEYERDGYLLFWKGYDKYSDLQPDRALPNLPNWLLYLQNPKNKFLHQEETKKQIECTGYSTEELKLIEEAFESVRGMFNGLIAVVDVLADIHKVDLSVKEEAKSLFVKL